LLDPKTLCLPGPAFGLGLVEYAAGAKAPSQVLAKYTTSCSGPLVVIQPLWPLPLPMTGGSSFAGFDPLD
jgi:hypothetical protein